jgi:Protein of unknown function (DUF1566)
MLNPKHTPLKALIIGSFGALLLAACSGGENASTASSSKVAQVSVASVDTEAAQKHNLAIENADKNSGATTRAVNPVPVTPPTYATIPLNDTGIKATQCYQIGSNTLVSCTSAAAIALNAKQDGMVGFDVTAPSALDGELGSSYVKVANNGSLLTAAAALGAAPTNWACTKDKRTGLTWEIKTAAQGLRHYQNYYSNYDSLVDPQNLEGTPPDQSQLDWETNSIGYRNAVNAMALCGYTNWRIPTAEELFSLYNFGRSPSSLLIDTDWFPNTASGIGYHSATKQTAQAGGDWAWYTWTVNFSSVDLSTEWRDLPKPVRLVR